MLAVLVVTFPFFALILCGYAAVRLAMLPQAAISGLNSFVLYFALPCMLYRFGSTTPVAQFVDPALIGTYFICAAAMVSFVIGISVRRVGWNDGAFGALVASFPNTGYMGVPLLVALLGAAAAGPAIVTILIDLLFTASVCIALSRLDGAGTHGAASAARDALRGVLTNPLPWAIVLGALSSAAGFSLWGPLGQTVGLLADAASPVALFTIGAVLARPQPDAAAPGRRATRDEVPLAFVKLVVHPALVYGAGRAAIALGAPLSGFVLTVLTLVAALPSASNAMVLAEWFGADSGRIARIILASTVLAFLTFSGAVTLLT
ncbi:MAG: AEC family transporter [Burkholderiales bacterium]|nr:AEC family transporter [Burkholderiales bacterium]